LLTERCSASAARHSNARKVVIAIQCVGKAEVCDLLMLNSAITISRLIWK
jgi:hypothetical protein